MSSEDWKEGPGKRGDWLKASIPGWRPVAIQLSEEFYEIRSSTGEIGGSKNVYGGKEHQKEELAVMRRMKVREANCPGDRNRSAPRP